MKFTPNAVAKRGGIPVSIEYHDDGPDALGRRQFSLRWEDTRKDDDPRGEWKRGEACVRGQHFFADPAEYVEVAS